MIEFQGVQFKNPIVASSSPATENIHNVQRCASKGVGGIILKSVGPDNIVKKNQFIPRRMFFDNGTLYMLSSSRREIMNIHEGQRLLRAAKNSISIPIVASVCGLCEELEEWKNLCKIMADVGADMIQLDLLYSVGFYKNLGMQSFKAIVSLAEEVENLTGKPVLIKLSTRVPLDIAIRCLKGKNIAVSLLDSIQVGIPVNLTADNLSAFRGVIKHGKCLAVGKVLYPLTLLYTQELHKNNIGPVCAGGGVFNGYDAVALLLSGADLVQVATAICVYGFDIIPSIVSQLNEVLHKNKIEVSLDAKRFSEIINHEETEVIEGFVVRKRLEECINCQQKACQKTVMCGSKNRSCEGCGLCIDVCSKENTAFKRR